MLSAGGPGAESAQEMPKKVAEFAVRPVRQRIADLIPASPGDHNPSLSERAQVFRDGGLADFEEVGEIAGAGLRSAAEVVDDPQSDRMAERSEHARLGLGVLVHSFRVHHL